jgi:PPIC-type peptidyl-prolyl cis-trans isomerase-like protein
MNNKYFTVLIFLLIAICTILFSCSSENKNTVLEIDDFKLSAHAFNLSFKIAPAILKFGDTPQLNYLNTIKNEYLVTQYLLRQGLGKDSSLSKILRLLRQELIVEKMFYEDVDSKIKITDEEIRSEILKGNKQVKVKYIFTKELSEAEEIKNCIGIEKSFEELQEEKLFSIGLNSEAGETEFINYGEVDPKINAVMFALEPGKVSEIIKTDAGYFLLKVADIRKLILSESDIKRLTPTYKKILLNKSMNSEARMFVKNFMDPMNIVVDGKVFQDLVNSLYQTYKKNTNSVSLQSNQEFLKYEDYKEKFDKELLDKALVSFNGGNISTAEMLYHFSYYPVSFPTTSIDDFAAELKKKIGLRLLDIFMEREGIKRGYGEIKIINEELQLWKNQIVSYRYLQKLSDEINVDTTELKKIYKENIKSLVPFSTVEHKLVNSYKDYLIYKKLVSIVEIESLNHEIETDAELLRIENEYPANKLNAADIFTYKMGLPYSRLAFSVPNRIWAAEYVWKSIMKN